MKLTQRLLVENFLTLYHSIDVLETVIMIWLEAFFMSACEQSKTKNGI